VSFTINDDYQPTLIKRTATSETIDEQEKQQIVSFTINDDYQPTLIKRTATSETIDEQEKQQTIQSVMPVLKGFMSAISD